MWSVCYQAEQKVTIEALHSIFGISLNIPVCKCSLSTCKDRNFANKYFPQKSCKNRSKTTS